MKTTPETILLRVRLDRRTLAQATKRAKAAGMTRPAWLGKLVREAMAK